MVTTKSKRRPTARRTTGKRGGGAPSCRSRDEAKASPFRFRHLLAHEQPGAGRLPSTGNEERDQVLDAFWRQLVKLRTEGLVTLLPVFVRHSVTPVADRPDAEVNTGDPMRDRALEACWEALYGMGIPSLMGAFQVVVAQALVDSGEMIRTGE